MADQEETVAAETSEPTEVEPTQATEETTEPPQEQAEEKKDEGDEKQEETEATTDGQAEETAATQETTEGEEGKKTPVEGEGLAEGNDEKVPEGEAGDEEQAKPEGESEEKKEDDGEKTGDDAEVKEGDEAADGVEEKKEGEEAVEVVKEGEDEEKNEEGNEEEKKDGEDDEEKGDEEKKEDGEKKEDDEKEDGSKSPVPQSDTFAEGERAESPIGVGEKLSREGTPDQEIDKPKTEQLEPGTPDRSRPPSETGEEKHLETFREEEEEEEDEEDEEEEQFDREALMEQYSNAIAEREKLQAQNYQLQHKLAEHFRKKKQDESRQDYDKNANDQDTKYVKYMGQLDELRKEDMHVRDTYENLIEELKERCEERKQMVDEERKKFMEFKKQVGLNSFSNRSGKPIPPKDIDQYLANETKKEAEVVNVRLENIKLKNKLKKKEMQLKSKEELAENLHLIDFEQLKIENQTYNEKIEERNEELLKLRKKITSTVQVLTHLKEKLQFVQVENQVQKSTLWTVEADAAQKRDILTRTKQARDALRIDNQRLRQSCGLLGNEPLLRDFEERKDEGDDLRKKLEQLKMQHAELTLNCNQVRRKVEQARASHG